jgi:hypothetical protein
LVLNINYVKEGKHYAFMSYGVFTKDSKFGKIDGIRITRQLVMVRIDKINIICV